VADEPPGPRGKTLAWVGSTYFAEGLPWSVLHQIAAEYLTAIGVRPAQVGYTSGLHATLSLKVLWSPFVELFGTLRQWMIGMQAMMGATIGLLAVVAHRAATMAGSESADLTWIWAALIAIGVLSATHDIACDGYYMDVLHKDDQASFSGARTAAFRAAMFFGSSGLVVLGGRTSWLVAFGLAGAIMLGLAVAHRMWLAPGRSEGRPRSDAPRERPHGRRWQRIKTSYLSFLRQDRAVLVILFIATLKLADSLMFAMSKVLLDRELGVPTDLRGVLNGFGTAAAITGAIVGGAWIGRKTLGRTLFLIALAMALTEPLYVLMAMYAPELAVSIPGMARTMADIDVGAAAWKIGVIGAIVVIEQFCGGLATVAQMIFIMRRCHPDHKAAHFAFATAIYSVAQLVTGVYSGHAYEYAGPVGYYWIVTALTIPAVALVRFVPKD
jgi:PAT family beta-lactamase induction signal transducer AmpG